MACIVILEHELQKGINRPFLIYRVVSRLRAAGHKIVIHHGIDPQPPPADLLILHVNLTVVPPDYAALAATYPSVINGAALDMSKRVISRNILDRDSDWTGPVIVKTDANVGGYSELLLHNRALQSGTQTDIVVGPVLKKYPIYRSLKNVPDTVWETDGLVVERFLPEHDERGYYVHLWSFLGDAERCLRTRAANPIVKVGNMIDSEPSSVPEEIRAWRKELGYEWGKFDFVIYDGRPVLLDVTRTPHGSSLMGDLKFLEELARGLEGFLP